MCAATPTSSCNNTQMEISLAENIYSDLFTILSDCYFSSSRVLIVLKYYKDKEDFFRAGDVAQ